MMIGGDYRKEADMSPELSADLCNEVIEPLGQLMDDETEVLHDYGKAHEWCSMSRPVGPRAAILMCN